MTIAHVGILLIRLFGIYLFFDVMIVITELPIAINNLLRTQVDYMRPEYDLVIAMALLRLLIYGVFGVCFLCFARPIAKVFAKDLT